MITKENVNYAKDLLVSISVGLERVANGNAEIEQSYLSEKITKLYKLL